MGQNKEQAINRAKADLVKRLKIKENEISHTIEDADFPDMSLGASEADEMSGQMMTSGWKIRLSAKGKNYEYRADSGDQLRLFQFNGANYKVR